MSKYCSAPYFLSYLKKYKFILNKVIKKAKATRNDEYISRSSNKIKALWNVVKQETGMTPPPWKNTSLLINQVNVTDPTINANTFNSYFSRIADNLLSNLNANYKFPRNATSNIDRVLKKSA